MSRGELKTNDFSYHLPDEKIAKHPLNDRNASRLLVYKKGNITDSRFKDLKNHLPNNTRLVFNNTRVLSARLIFSKSTGAKIEVFCLEPHNITVEQALSSTDTCTWNCIVGNLKRFKSDDPIYIEIANTKLKAELIKKRENDVVVKFTWDNKIDFSSILNEAGKVPLPPYLNREMEESDKENYQTVYAENEGAVAAPTAGLHFTDKQIDDLKKQGHYTSYLTLHVGAGTFKPVKSENLIDHQMHEERIVISKETLIDLEKEQVIVAVGTTSLRSLESLYWLAVKMKSNNSDSFENIDQDDAYHFKSSWTWQEACSYLISFLNNNNLNEVDFSSALFIMKGYDWKVINGLVTNFHQPQSTLLALVSSWIGDDWKKVYEYALQKEFRFLSFGDSSLLLN